MKRRVRSLTLPEVVKAALGEGPEELSDEELRVLEDLPTRFPIQVDKQTRVFLEYHAQSLGTSIAALSGLILKQVVEATLQEQKAKKAPRRLRGFLTRAA